VDANDVQLREEAKEGWAEGRKRLEEGDVKKRLQDAQSGLLAVRQGDAGPSSSVGSTSSSRPCPSTRTVSIQSPPTHRHHESRPVHKSHSRAHQSAVRSAPLSRPSAADLKKGSAVQSAKSKAISSLAAKLLANSARKMDPFTHGGIGVMGRSSSKLPDLVSRKK
jgi:hypothetical protein